MGTGGEREQIEAVAVNRLILGAREWERTRPSGELHDGISRALHHAFRPAVRGGTGRLGRGALSIECASPRGKVVRFTFERGSQR